MSFDHLVELEIMLVSNANIIKNEFLKKSKEEQRTLAHILNFSRRKFKKKIKKFIYNEFNCEQCVTIILYLFGDVDLNNCLIPNLGNVVVEL